MKVDVYKKVRTVEVKGGEKLITTVDLDDGVQAQKEIRIHEAQYRGLHQFFGPNLVHFAIIDNDEGFQLSDHVKTIESENDRYNEKAHEQSCKIFDISNYIILLEKATLFQRIFKWKSLLTHKPK